MFLNLQTVSGSINPRVIADELLSQFPNALLVPENPYEVQREKVRTLAADQKEISPEHIDIILRSIDNKEKSIGEAIDIHIPVGDKIMAIGRINGLNINFKWDGPETSESKRLADYLRALRVGVVAILDYD